jgi:hypothetical protein
VLGSVTAARACNSWSWFAMGYAPGWFRQQCTECNGDRSLSRAKTFGSLLDRPTEA